MTYCRAKGGNQEEHVYHLKTEAQQLIAALKAPIPERKTQRGLPYDQAVRFLKSWLDWVEKEEGRTYGDPVLEAIQRLEKLFAARPTEGSASSSSGEHEERGKEVGHELQAPGQLVQEEEHH